MNGIKMPAFISSRWQRYIKSACYVLIAVVVIVFIAGYILSHVAENKIEKSLIRAGGKVGSIDINLFLQRITLSDIEIFPFGDSISNPSKIRIQNIVLKNFDIYLILLHRHLKIGELLIEEGAVLYNKKLKIVSGGDSSRNILPLQKISIDNIIIRNIYTEIINDSIPEYSGTISLKLQNVQSSDTADISSLQAYSIKNFEASIKKAELHDKPGLYIIKIGELTASSNKKNLTIDSLLLIPKHSKFRFSRAVGKQTDRLNVFVRNIDVQNIHYDQLIDSAFVASSINIVGGEVYSFRDKRIPFRETQNKPLPMEALTNLSIDVEVDSITITDTKITYEEFPEEGFNSGKVTFEDLEAKFINVGNRNYYNRPNFSTLTARAKLMGKGLIEATFYLPMNDQPYRAHGRISNMSLHHLNPALENLAFISIESGRLNEIDFDFSYTNDISDGTLTINYQNLKIKGLKKEKGIPKNDLKTLLINTFIKSDKDKSVPMDKRTGAISFERDKKRQIFNYWWKSLLSGIKGSVLNISDKKQSQKKSPK